MIGKSNSQAGPRGILQRWNAQPLYLRIVITMIVGAVTGVLLEEKILGDDGLRTARPEQDADVSQ